MAQVFQPPPALSGDRDVLLCEDSEADTRRLRIEQIRLLSTNNLIGLVLSIIVATTLCLILWRYVDTFRLLGWMAAVSVTMVSRYLRLHRSASYAADDPERWTRAFLYWTTLTGVVWGSAAVFLFPESSVPHQVFLAFLLGGLVVGAVALYSAMLNAVVLFTLPTVIPVTVQLFRQGSEVQMQMAGLTGLFVVIVFIIAWRMNEMTMRALRLGIVNNALIDFLTRAKEDAERLNTDLEHQIRERAQIEEKLRIERDFISAVLDTEGALVVVFDRDGRIVRFNRACQNATGYAFREVRDAPFWELLIAPGEQEFMRRLYGRMIEGGIPDEYECHWLTKGRGQRLIGWSHTAILGPDGAVNYIIGAGIDLTERRQAERALAKSQEDFRLLVEGVSDYAIFMTDPHGAIVNWNSGAERITGYPADEIVGHHLSCFCAFADLGLDATAARPASAGATVSNALEGWCLRRDGTRFWATVAVTPLRDDAGNLRGYSVITGDITVRKQTEDTIRSLLRISAQLNATLELDELIASLVRESILLVGAEGGCAGLRSDGRLVCRRYFRGGRDEPCEHEFPPGRGFAGWVLEHKTAYVANDVRSDPRAVAALCEELDVRSAICVPILDYRDEVLGFLEIHNKEHGGAFGRADEEKLTAVTQSASLALQNALAFRRLQDAEALLAEEARVLEMIAKGAPLDGVLLAVLRILEAHHADSAPFILTLDDKGAAFRACISPVFPPARTEALVRSPAPELLARLRAATERGESTALHPLPQGVPGESGYPTGRGGLDERYRSMPIVSQTGVPLGILATRATGQGVVEAQALGLMERTARVAGIAIERWRAEERLQLRDRAIESSLNAILIGEVRGSRNPILYANPAVTAITGYAQEEVIGRDWLFESQQAPKGPELEYLRDALQKRHDGHAVVRSRRKDGSSFWSEIFVAPVRDRDGSVSRFVAVMNDITDRVEAEGALKESEAKYKAITSNVPGMVFQLVRRPDREYYFSYVSDGSCALCGIAPEEIHRDLQVFTELVVREDRPSFFHSMRAAGEHLTTWNWEGRIRRPDGSEAWISAASSPRVLPEGLLLWDGIITDITASKLAELELKASREQLRELSSHLQTVREEEKAQIAREIHDELGSTLTALKMEISWLLHKLPAQAEPLREKARSMLERVHSTIGATRRISTGLRPPVLDDLGLCAAIEWQVSEFQGRMGIRCDVTTSPDVIDLDDGPSIALFRILQEALTNIARHARASRVNVILRTVDGIVCLVVEDNGIGLPDDWALRRSSHGILGMFERAKALGGDIRVAGRKGRGTILTARIPVREGDGGSNNGASADCR